MAFDLYPLIRPLLFSLEAERAHHLTLRAMNLAQRMGVLSHLTGLGERPNRVQSVEVMGLRFPNRVGLAAGLDKAGTAVDAFGAIGFGHVEVGTVTPRPQPGNPSPRLFRLVQHQAVINRMGFNNPGVEGLLENLQLSRRQFTGVLGINIGKNFDTSNEDALDDYVRCFQSVAHAADYVTANLSSPNTKGLRDLQNETFCRELITRLQAIRSEMGLENVPLVIKIAPDLKEEAVRSLAEVFSEEKIDGVIATNTTINREAVADHSSAKEIGGLSGAPLSQQSTKVISWLRSEMAPAIPIIASGGVMSAADAQEKLDAGAALVQVYTGLIYRGPRLVGDLGAL